jgi:hypothetical protein
MIMLCYDHGRHKIATASFEDLPLEILQHFATSQPDPNLKHYAVFQDIAKSAGDIFSARNQSEALTVDAVTSMLGTVGKDWCLMHTLSNSLELELSPTRFDNNFLTQLGTRRKINLDLRLRVNSYFKSLTLTSWMILLPQKIHCWKT